MFSIDVTNDVKSDENKNQTYFSVAAKTER